MSRCIAIRSDYRLPLLIGLLATLFALVTSGCHTEAPLSDRKVIQEAFNYISAEELKDMIDRGEPFNLVDIRSVQEYLAGHLPNAISIPYSQLTYRYRELDPRTAAVIYCQKGLSSILAAKMLARLGFCDLYSLSKGFADWKYAVELGDRRQVV